MSEKESEECESVPKDPPATEEKSREEEENKQQQQQEEEDGWLSMSTWTNASTNWLQVAKDKTISTLEMVKKDLNEFTQVVQSEATHIASATATAIQEQAKNIEKIVVEDEKQTETEIDQPESSQTSQPQQTTHEDKVETENKNGGSWMQMGWLMDTVNKALYIEDTTVGEEKDTVPIQCQFNPVTEAPGSTRLYAIQTCPSTYRNEPEGAPELFDDWLDHFDLSQHKDTMSKLLSTNPTVRTLYAQLVPSELSNNTFWQRYFYRVHQFELDDARRQAILDKGNSSKDTLITKNSWGDDEQSDSDAELQPEDSKTPETEVAVVPEAGSSTPDEAWSLCSSGDATEEHNDRAKTPTKNEDWVDWDGN